jgi:hypothetical protein
MYACEMPACEMPACEMHAYEMHAYDKLCLQHHVKSFRTMAFSGQNPHFSKPYNLKS